MPTPSQMRIFISWKNSQTSSTRQNIAVFAYLPPHLLSDLVGAAVEAPGGLGQVVRLVLQVVQMRATLPKHLRVLRQSYASAF